MDKLTAMRVFAAVADAGGFAPAARDLGMSTSAVSRHVAELEAALSVELLRRSTRRMSLTEVGERYLNRANGILDEVRALEADIGDLAASPKGRLRLTASPTFGDFFLAPIAARFAQRYPELTIEMDLTERLVDVVAEGYDAAIRAGRLTDSTLTSRRLLDYPFVAVASPDYVAKAPPLERPEDLARHQCVHWRWRSDTMIWRFMDGDEVVEVPVTGRFRVNSTFAEREAARAGLGIALFSPLAAKDDLASGRLVTVLPNHPPAPMAITALWPAARATPRKLRLFIDFLSVEMQKLSATEPFWAQGARK